MDIKSFLGKLEENATRTGSMLFEAAGGAEGWENVSDEYKEAILEVAGSAPSWAYQPGDRALVICENSEDDWSIYAFDKSLALMAQESRIYEADKYGSFDVGDVGTAGTEGGEGEEGERGGYATAAKTVLANGSFEDCLKECVEIVQKDLFKI